VPDTVVAGQEVDVTVYARAGYMLGVGATYEVDAAMPRGQDDPTNPQGTEYVYHTTVVFKMPAHLPADGTVLPLDRA
jgi:hypothetical protein